MQKQKLRKQKMVAFQDKRHEIRNFKKKFYVNKCKIEKTVRNENGYKKSENFQKTC